MAQHDRKTITAGNKGVMKMGRSLFNQTFVLLTRLRADGQVIVSNALSHTPSEYYQNPSFNVEYLNQVSDEMKSKLRMYVKSYVPLS